MTTLAQRLKQEMERTGLKQEELAQKAGVSQALIHKLVSGKALESRKISKIAAALGVNTDWLANGGDFIEGAVVMRMIDHKPKIDSNGSYLGVIEEWDSDTPLDDDEVALPFFREVELAAGIGRFQVQENHGCKLRFSKSTLKRHGVSVDNAYCVTVSGNSMEPMMPDGCVIGVDTSVTVIKNGDIYAVDHNGHLRVKVLYRMPDGRIRLRSLNIDEWPDEYVGGDELQTFKVLGRVFYGSWLR